jgi:phage portal protein BeeE
MPVTHGVAGSSPVHSAKRAARLRKTLKSYDLSVFFAQKIA